MTTTVIQAQNVETLRQGLSSVLDNTKRPCTLVLVFAPETASAPTAWGGLRDWLAPILGRKKLGRLPFPEQKERYDQFLASLQRTDSQRNRALFARLSQVRVSEKLGECIQLKLDEVGRRYHDKYGTSSAITSVSDLCRYSFKELMSANNIGTNILLLLFYFVKSYGVEPWGEEFPSSYMC